MLGLALSKTQLQKLFAGTCIHRSTGALCLAAIFSSRHDTVATSFLGACLEASVQHETKRKANFGKSPPRQHATEYSLRCRPTDSGAPHTQKQDVSQASTSSTDAPALLGSNMTHGCGCIPNWPPLRMACSIPDLSPCTCLGTKRTSLLGTRA